MVHLVSAVFDCRGQLAGCEFDGQEAVLTYGNGLRFICTTPQLVQLGYKIVNEVRQRIAAGEGALQQYVQQFQGDTFSGLSANMPQQQRGAWGANQARQFAGGGGGANQGQQHDWGNIQWKIANQGLKSLSLDEMIELRDGLNQGLAMAVQGNTRGSWGGGQNLTAPTQAAAKEMQTA